MLVPGASVSTWPSSLSLSTYPPMSAAAAPVLVSSTQSAAPAPPSDSTSLMTTAAGAAAGVTSRPATKGGKAPAVVAFLVVRIRGPPVGLMLAGQAHQARLTVRGRLADVA